MANDNDMRAHSETYAGVINMLKWGSVATAIVAIIVIMLITGHK